MMSCFFSFVLESYYLFVTPRFCLKFFFYMFFPKRQLILIRPFWGYFLFVLGFFSKCKYHYHCSSTTYHYQCDYYYHHHCSCHRVPLKEGIVYQQRYNCNQCSRVQDTFGGITIKLFEQKETNKRRRTQKTHASNIRTNKEVRRTTRKQQPKKNEEKKTN